MRIILAILLYVAIVAIHAEEKNEHLPDDCGRFLNFKYFGGNLTEFDDYPWLVLLEYDTPRGRSVSCGGVLLSFRYVLTAGHCVSNLGGNWTLSSVRLGEYDTNTSPDCLPDGNADNTSTCIPEAISIGIEKLIVHENYTRVSRIHDLALIRLAEDVTFTEFIKPICLPRKDAQPQKFHVAGWGRLAGRQGSNVKLRSYASLGNGTSCREWYAWEKIRVVEDQFCAAAKEDEHPCIGDSGSPLMGVEKMADGSYKMAVFGILSMDSRFCDLEGWPGVYVDVLLYRSWILQNIK